MTDREFCPYSGKVMYPSRNQANEVAKRMRARSRLVNSKQRGPEPEVYICKSCKTYHIGRPTLKQRGNRYGTKARPWKPLDDE